MTDQTGYEMELQRAFDAPREQVFDAFTNAAQLKAWCGPRDFTNPVCEVDARMGGHILIHMQGPEGPASPMEGDFIEVDRPFRLIFAARALKGADGEWGIDTLNTVTLMDKDGGTALTLHVAVRKVSEAVRPALAGMREGWMQSFDKLDELLVGLRG